MSWRDRQRSRSRNLEIKIKSFQEINGLDIRPEVREHHHYPGDIRPSEK